jgi:molybdenum cofactor guanylyltransferase
LKTNQIEYTGIILSGGKSRRMGRDKSLIKIGNLSLIEHQINLIKPLCSEILISSGNKELEYLGYPLIEDEFQECGPMAGIYSCLMKANYDWSFVISVDTPFVTQELIETLAAQTSGFECVIPFHGNGIEPLVGFYHRQVVTVILGKIKNSELKMSALIESLNVNLVDIDGLIKKDKMIIFNINNPGDLEQVLL